MPSTLLCHPHTPLRTAVHALLAACVCSALSVPRLAAAKPTAPGQASQGVAEVVTITVPAASTSPQSTPAIAPSAMRTLVFKPAGKGPFKVLLFAHGRPAYAAQRAQLVHPMSYGHVRYWLDKGYAVVAPIRPGYGPADSANPTLGTAATKAGTPSATARTTPATPAARAIDPENSGVAYSASGQCLRRPQPERTAQAAAHAQRAALDWVRQQPWARADHIVLEGQSVGGLATLALCAAQPPGVKGCINFAGGAGGNPQQAPARMCQPEQTTQLMRQLGSQPQPPSIWLYAQNDMYWGAQAPQQWHTAFSQAANASALTSSRATTPAARSTFVQTPPIGSDGHSLLRAGTQHWGPPMEAWLRQHGL